MERNEYMTKADELYSSGELDAAFSLINKAIEIAPESFGAWIMKGNILDDQGRHEEAIEAFNEAIKITPDEADARYNKGNVLSSLYRYEEAIEAYDQAINIKPDDPDSWCNKGISAPPPICWTQSQGCIIGSGRRGVYGRVETSL